MDIYLKRLTNAYKHIVVGGSVVVDSPFMLLPFDVSSVYCHYSVMQYLVSFAVLQSS